MKMKAKRIYALLIAFVMLFGLVSSALAVYDMTTDEYDALALEIAEESIVLIENNGKLPLEANSNVALFGTNWFAGGEGSSAVAGNPRDLEEGLEQVFNLTGAYEIGWRGAAGGCNPDPNALPESYTLSLTEEEIASAADDAETAVVVISRTAGEGSDLTTLYEDSAENDVSWYKRYYYMLESELQTIENCSKYFENTVVVINAPCLMDISWYKNEDGTFNYDIDALIYAGLPGDQGGIAVANIIAGIANPSGKLVDTWAFDIADHPSTVNSNTYIDGVTQYVVTSDSAEGVFKYWGGVPKFQNVWLYPEGTYYRATDEHFFTMYEEGIYIGYRYFETFDVPVAYEFGYGLSYTDFDVDIVDAYEAEGYITAEAKVTNIGSTAGKEVVQVYFSQPEGELSKSGIELGAYGKTDLLATGEAQTLTIRYKTESMYSYDEESSAYFMDAGDYEIYVGTSVKDRELAYTYRLDDYTVVNDVENITAVQEKYADSFTEMTSIETYPDDSDVIRSTIGLRGSCYVEEGDEYYLTYPQPRISVQADNDYSEEVREAATVALANAEKAAEDGTIIKLIDVYNGEATLEEFAAQLSVVELCDFVCGQGNFSNNRLFGDATASNNTGSTLSHELYGVPTVNMSDGPHGVGSGKYKVEWPCEINQGMTWNTEILEEMGVAVGNIMQQSDVDIWLAPNLNVHRNPLNGRGMECYSEDPVIIGTMAAAVTKGVQSTGSGVAQKHFCSYDVQCGGWYNTDDIATERTYREFYLKGWEIGVTTSNPWSIMSSYSMLNGTYQSASEGLNYQVLRNEYGWDGVVMTDWEGDGAVPVECLNGGTNLLMPSAIGEVNYLYRAYNESELYGEIITHEEGKNLSRDILEESFIYLMKLVMKTDSFAEYYGIDQIIEDTSALPIYMDCTRSEIEAATIISAADIEAAYGDTVDMVVSVSNADDIGAVTFVIECDTDMVKLALDGDVKTPYNREFNVFDYGYKFIVWSTDGIKDGELISFQFTVDELFANGSYPVTVKVLEAADAMGNGFNLGVTGAVSSITFKNGYPLGDINMDMTVSNADVVLLARYLVGLTELSVDQLKLADVNADNSVSNADLVGIARMLVE